MIVNIIYRVKLYCGKKLYLNNLAKNVLIK